MDRYMSEKELFVAGLNGTTFIEINMIVHYPIVLSGFRGVALSLFPSFLLSSRVFRFLLEYMFLIIPIIGVTTFLTENISSIFVTTLAMSLLGAIILPPKGPKTKSIQQKLSYAVDTHRSAAEDLVNDGFDLTADESQFIDKNDGISDSIFESCIMSRNRVPGITLFRSWVTVISCVCILAVDFNIFPRRLAKTELYGTGLMDTGVGLFIVSNAIVSPEARSKFHDKGRFSERLTYTKETMIATWPLWLIGMLRAISIKLVGYQEHVTEYGVHWNFFFTLAVVRILSSFLLAFTSKSLSLMLSILCIGFYQFVLLYPACNVTDTLLNNNRQGVLMANKEGVFSCLGYLSLYLAAVDLGSLLFKPRQPNLNSWIRVTVRLFLTSAFLWLVTYTANSVIQPISRRFANLAYVTWVLSMSYSLIAVSILTILFLILCSQYKNIANDLIPDKCLLQYAKKDIEYRPPPPDPCLVTAVNQNQFFYFILSNLFTGIANICFDTLHTLDSYAFLILSVYMFVSLLIVWVLHTKQFKLKYW